MSLDVWLVGGIKEPEVCGHCGGTGKIQFDRETLWERNTTHNLGRMAEEAGIYRPIWHPEECAITTAKQLIQPLRDGLALLESDEPRFSRYDAPNGWGIYEHLVAFVREYLSACEENPDAEVRTCR